MRSATRGLLIRFAAAHGTSRRSVRLHYARLRAVAATAIAALAAASAATAQAAPHWYGNGTLIQGSALVKSKAKVGQLSFNFSPSGSVTCTVSAALTVENPTSGEAGTDQLIALATRHCTE